MVDADIVQMGLRIPRRIRDAIEVIAKDERRSLNMQVELILEEAIQKALRSRLMEYLDNVIEPTQPWTLESGLYSAFEQFETEDIDEALSALRAAEEIDSSSDPHSGEVRIATTRALSHPDFVAEQESYQSLKFAVIETAESRGLEPRWRAGAGWSLVGVNGKEEAVGNMRDLAEHLGIIGANAKRNVKRGIK